MPVTRASGRLKTRYNSLAAGRRDEGDIVVDSIRFGDDTVLTSASAVAAPAPAPAPATGPTVLTLTYTAGEYYLLPSDIVADQNWYEFELVAPNVRFWVPPKNTTDEQLSVSVDSAFGFMLLREDEHYTHIRSSTYHELQIPHTMANKLKVRIHYSN